MIGPLWERWKGDALTHRWKLNNTIVRITDWPTDCGYITKSQSYFLDSQSSRGGSSHPLSGFLDLIHSTDGCVRPLCQRPSNCSHRYKKFMEVLYYHSRIPLDHLLLRAKAITWQGSPPTSGLPSSALEDESEMFCMRKQFLLEWVKHLRWPFSL